MEKKISLKFSATSPIMPKTFIVCDVCAVSCTMNEDGTKLCYKHNKNSKTNRRKWVQSRIVETYEEMIMLHELYLRESSERIERLRSITECTFEQMFHAHLDYVEKSNEQIERMNKLLVLYGINPMTGEKTL